MTEKFTAQIGGSKENENRVNDILVNLHVGVAVFSSDGSISLCNRRFFELGRPKNLEQVEKHLIEQSILTKSIIENIPKITIETIIKNYVNEDGLKLTKEEFPVMRVINTGEPVNDNIIGVRNKDKEVIRWLLGNYEPEFDETGKLTSIIVTVIEITRRVKAEKALKESQNRLNAFLKVMPDMFFILDRDGTITDNYLENTNIPYHIQVGYLGKNIIDINFINKLDAERVFKSIGKLFETGEIQTIEFKYLAFDGREVVYEARLTLYGANKVLAVVTDIGQRKETEKIIYKMSIRDTSTGLYNRNYFEHALDKYSNKDITGVGIVTCDIDGLKLVNDTLGHATGDEYLKIAANLLTECFGTENVVARIGGDEFTVLIDNTTTKQLSDTELKIEKLMSTINLEKRTIPFSMSMGYAIGNGKQTDLRELMKVADNLMYREKLHHRQSEKSKNISILTKMLEARDFITEGHGDRMQDLSGKLAKAIGMSKNEIEDMRLFAQFHDIGKVGIPDKILFKPGKLDEDEMTEMRRHTEIGYRIAESSPDLIHISDWILKHHEWWDGNGYPFKLKGTEIPIQSRILSIVDAYDSMTNDRPYRRAMYPEDALMEISRCKGTQFDPRLVNRFLELIELDEK